MNLYFVRAWISFWDSRIVSLATVAEQQTHAICGVIRKTNDIQYEPSLIDCLFTCSFIFLSFDEWINQASITLTGAANKRQNISAHYQRAAATKRRFQYGILSVNCVIPSYSTVYLQIRLCRIAIIKIDSLCFKYTAYLLQSRHGNMYYKIN